MYCYFLKLKNLSLKILPIFYVLVKNAPQDMILLQACTDACMYVAYFTLATAHIPVNLTAYISTFALIAASYISRGF